MTDPEKKRLVSLVIADTAGKIAVGYRSSHRQWQLFGGRISADARTGDRGIPELAAIRHARDKLGIHLGVSDFRMLGSTKFLYGGTEIESDWLFVPTIRIEDELTLYPMTMNPGHYDRVSLLNPNLLRTVNNPDNSPNLEHFLAAYRAGGMALSLDGPDTVQ